MKPRRTQETVQGGWRPSDELPYGGAGGDVEDRRRTGARAGPRDLVVVPVLFVRDTPAMYRAFQRFTRAVRDHAGVRVSDACIGRAAVRVLLRQQREILRAVDFSRFGDREAREDDFVRVLERAFGLSADSPAATPPPAAPLPPAPATVDELTATSRLQYPGDADSQGGER